MTETELKNLTLTLNLEYGATYRYDLQVDRFTSPKVVALLEGVRRNEADHIAKVMQLVEASAESAPQGFRSLYTHLKLNLEFEREAVRIYSQAARETENPEVRELFRELVKSEAGHVRLFGELIRELDEGRYPRVFFCPLCGWELDYGDQAALGDIRKCEKCGVKYELTIENGDYQLSAV
ncbi:MAG: ferritin-like domain-containing protein [bacterium]